MLAEGFYTSPTCSCFYTVICYSLLRVNQSAYWVNTWVWPTCQSQFLLGALSTCSLLCEFRISNFLTAFCGNSYNFWALLAWVWLVYLCWIIHVLCPLSLMTLKILLCWKFSNGVWRWQNWFVVSGCHLSPKVSGEVFSGEHIASIQLP